MEQKVGFLNNRLFKFKKASLRSKEEIRKYEVVALLKYLRTL